MSESRMAFVCYVPIRFHDRGALMPSPAELLR
jgi:hypothetical protein